MHKLSSKMWGNSTKLISFAARQFSSASPSKMETSIQNGVRTLLFNRPNRKNAIAVETYKEITDVLNEDAKNDNVVLTILSGKGEYFSSGNDFKSALTTPGTDSAMLASNMVDAFIDYPKLLVSVVNGPSIGIATTITALSDIIYCSDKATFETPFVRLGISTEGCSSYTFPRILGRSKFSEMLFFNHKLTAKEAHNLGFVADVIPHEKLDEFIKSLHRFGKLPVSVVKRNKHLIMKWNTDVLKECNKYEKIILDEALQSDEFHKAVAEFLSRKSKL